MSDLVGRAEDIAAHLVSHAFGAEAMKFDVDADSLRWTSCSNGATAAERRSRSLSSRNPTRPPDVLSFNPDLAWLSDIGVLRRTSFRLGVVLLPVVRAEFVEAATSDFTTLVEGWLQLPHMPRHVERARTAVDVDERHLFLVPVDEVLPARLFTSDFPAPTRTPEGFSGIDGVWVWSNYWHQYLVWLAGK